MSEYFDAQHERAVIRLEQGHTARTEWPTWLLLALIYGGWFGTLMLFGAGHLRLPATTLALVILNAWYMSLQHELLHGHPTRSARLNQILGCAPFAIWSPYALYRDKHLAHHRDEDLTVPGVDPESNYVQAHRWQQMSQCHRALWHVRKTFIGRLLVGPPMMVFALLADAVREWLQGDFRYLRMWLMHGALVIAMLVWLDTRIGIPYWYYLLAISWPTQSLAMARSFREHRAAPAAKARIAINEAGTLMRLLYLNNNYHLIHHDLPRVPWYHLPRVYQMRRDAYREKCGNFVIHGGYWELLRLYALRQTDTPLYPSAANLLLQQEDQATDQASDLARRVW